MRILAINGSPRGPKSNTDRLLQPFLQGAAAAGALCETVYAVDLDIKECIGCFSCWEKTPGVCIFKDEMIQLLEKIRQTDILVWATPVYHFEMNVRLKRIVERTLPLNLPYMVNKGDRFVHPARFKDGPAKTVLIANCGFPDRSNFDQLVGAFHKIAGGDGLAATILCGGGELLGVEHLQSNLDWYKNAVYEAGREIVQSGAFTKETTAILETPLMATETFISFANAHWNVAGETPPSLEEALGGAAGIVRSGETIETRPLPLPFGHDTFRDLIAGMPIWYQPESVPGLKAVIQFNVSGKEPGHYFLEIANGECHAFAGKHPAPQLTVHTPSEVWMEIARGELDGKDALLQGKYFIDGDLNLMIRFGSLFKSPAVPDVNPGKLTEVRA